MIDQNDTRKNMRKAILNWGFAFAVFGGVTSSEKAFGQASNFYFGNDLSYVNQMEDCGAIYKENNTPKDPFQIFADHGTNLVRVRLWVDPSWWQDPLEQPAGVKPHYNDIVDVKKTIQRAKNAGMQVMLGIHYSDFWADPGRQLIPRKWVSAAYDLEVLKDSVYNYTYRVLTELDAEGLMPELVKVGNENNSGILRDIPEENGYESVEIVSESWSRHAQLFNSAIKAVRDVGSVASIDPKIVIHFSLNLNTQVWNYGNIISNGVTDFDIIGFSYYYSWHGGSINELQQTIVDLKTNYPQYDVMVAETGYPWTTANFDALANIVTTPDPDYLPVIPEKQLEYMVDFSRAVMKAGGIGVVFWEPAWVSTPCNTPWGQGSAHDHLVFFDFENTNFMENGGGRWMEHQFYDLTKKKVIFKIDMTGQEVSDGVFISGNFNDKQVYDTFPMANEGNGIYSYFTFLNENDSGGYFFSTGNEIPKVKESIPANCADWQNENRFYHIQENDTIFGNIWDSCEQLEVNPPSIDVTFAVDMTGEDVSNGVYITGQMTNWEIVPLTLLKERIYQFSLPMNVGDEGAFYFLTTDSWDNYQDFRETVPSQCATWWDSDRGYLISETDTVFAYVWGSCEAINFSQVTGLGEGFDLSQVVVYPNPGADNFKIGLGEISGEGYVEIVNIQGQVLRKLPFFAQRKNEILNLPTSDILPGHYIVRILTKQEKIIRKLVIT